jgi:hypothetical protein
MATQKQISFTTLECKALWIVADIGLSMPCPELERDPDLEAAATRALDKVYRADRGIPRKGANPNPVRGAELDLVRKHRRFNCECPRCAKKSA